MTNVIWDYGNINSSSKLKQYSIIQEWKVMLFSDFIRMRSQEVIIEDSKKREDNRKKYNYLMYLDTHTEFYLNRIEELSPNEKFLLDTIIRVSVAKDKKIDLSKKRKDTSWDTNISFFDELKIILENWSSFPWVNQTDLALLVWAKQNDISRAFNDLIKKWFIVQNWADKKKFFKVSDIDLIGFYIMRYL